MIMDAEFMTELGEALAAAKEDAAESHKDDCNSYGAGWDAGYLAGLLAVAALLDIRLPEFG